MPLFVTIFVAKIFLYLTRLTGSGGSALPGLVAEKLKPTILKRLRQTNFKNGIILVTGTNGKTTTAKMIASIFQEAGLAVVHNKAGSNLSRGIASSLIKASNYRGKIGPSLGLFEVDEAAFGELCAKLKPSIVLVTNLFRDQLDRYGELDLTVKKLSQALARLDATICLNADDPLVASLALAIDNKKSLFFYGVSDYDGPVLANDNTADMVISPVSNSHLTYSQRFFGHIGHYQSQNGDFARPKPNLELTKMITMSDNSTKFAITCEANTAQIKLPLPGLYNIYNGLAATSVALKKGLAIEVIKTALAKTSAAFGRFEQINFRGHQLNLVLIKNPTGLNQIIQTFLLKNPANPIMLIINDGLADGRDVSWLWDSAIESLAGRSGPIIVSGTRAYDMSLRLKYANVDNFTTIVDVKKALGHFASLIKPEPAAYILPTYTAMLQIRKILISQADARAKDFWQ